MLETIVGKLKPRRFSGEVVDVQLIPGEGKNNFHRQFVTEHHGYDEGGMPITESYLEAVYGVALRNKEGEVKTFRMLGKPLEIGSQQTY